jgi:hypothetical protein
VDRPKQPSISPPSDDADRRRQQTASQPKDPDVQHVSVSATPESNRPLGLRYTILKRDGAGDYAEVDADTNFVSGDMIRLMVETNDTGYLYIVAQGTSKVWKVLYPSPEVGGGSNRVQRGQRYSIPNDSVFTFDSRRGTEKLFVVLARQPETDLESLIYSLEDRQQTNEPPRSMLAQNVGPIQDSLVQRLRNAYSRDLLIEKVDDTKKPAPDFVPQPAETKITGEKAVYVVNANGGPKARVVADIELRHE